VDEILAKVRRRNYWTNVSINTNSRATGQVLEVPPGLQIAQTSVLRTIVVMPSNIRVAVYIQPRAKRTEVAGRHGSDLKIRIAAPPVDHAANEALRAFVAKRLGVPQRNVRLIAGVTSRRKVLEIEGVTADQVEVLLA
jgi:uncharacterized protein